MLRSRSPAMLIEPSEEDFRCLYPVFGDIVCDPQRRQASYGLTESFVNAAQRSSKGTLSTSLCLEAFRTHLKSLSDKDFAFLLVHSGFIPDNYSDDSSEETLYSKLMEGMVAEWGERMGYNAFLPTLKASIEDVTFTLEDAVVVCDVKSYRLGRSQQAPNVKDVIKAEDYYKWLLNRNEIDKRGGLVVFPSKFDFSKASDVYLYASQSAAGRRIMILFYEHLAFFLLNKRHLNNDGIFSILSSYENVFAQQQRSREAYWNGVNEAMNNCFSLLTDCASIINDVQLIVRECVITAVKRIETRVQSGESRLAEELSELSAEALRARLLPIEFQTIYGADLRRLANIKRFRL